MSASTFPDDSKKTADAVELAEQLKASLEKPVREGRSPRPTAGERALDAELQALLREQLDGQSAPRSTGLMDMISAELADFEPEEDLSNIEPEDAPADIDSEDDFSNIEPEGTPADIDSEDDFFDVESETTPADIDPEDDFSDIEPEDAPADIDPKDDFSDIEPEDAPADIDPEDDSYTEDDIPAYDETVEASEPATAEAYETEDPSLDDVPEEEAFAEEQLIEERSLAEALNEEAPAEETPAEETSVEETPAEETPAEEAPAKEAPIEYERFTAPPAPKRSNKARPESTACSDDDRLNGLTLSQALSDTCLRDLDEGTRTLIQRLREARVGVSSHEADLAIAETFNQEELDGQMDVFSSIDAMEVLTESDDAGDAAPAALGTEAKTAPAHRIWLSDPLQVGPGKPGTEATVSLPEDYWLVKDQPATVLLTDASDDAQTDEPIEGHRTEMAPHEADKRPGASAPVGETTDHTTPAASKTYTVAEEADEQRRDTELFIRLGYETEINREDDAAHVDTVKADYIRSTEADRIGTRNTVPAVYAGREYHGRVAETAELEIRYDRAVRSAKAKLWFTLLCTLCGLCYDLCPLFVQEGTRLATFVASRLYPIGGMLLLIACCLPYVPRLVRGLRSLWDFEPVAYAVPGVSVLVALLHGVVSACLPEELRRPATFVAAALCALWPAVWSDLLTVMAEQKSFMVVSSGKRKFVVTEEADTPSALDDDTRRHATRRHADRLLVKKTRHVVDFFMWASRYHTRWGQLNYLVPMAILGALLSAVVVVLAGGTVAGDGLYMFVTVALCALPASLATVLTLPLFRADRIIAEQGSTVVGAASSEVYVASGDHNHATRLIFGDGAALKATAIKEITIKEEPRTETYRRMAQKIFALLGNPLDNSYRDTYRHESDGLRLEIAEARPDYAKMFLVNTRRREAVEVIMGTHAELTALGIHLPEERLERMYKKSPGSRVLYMVFDGKLRLMYATEYRIRSSFAQTVHALGQDGFAPVVTTCDPLVTEGIMQSRLLQGAPPVAMVRTTQYEEVHAGESSGLVATGRATDLAYPLRACRVMYGTHRLGAALQWPILALTVVLLTLVGAMGQTTWLPSILPAVWQMACTAAMALLSVGKVNRETLSVKSKKTSAGGSSAKRNRPALGDTPKDK